jgi:hypothetical protein
MRAEVFRDGAWRAVEAPDNDGRKNWSSEQSSDAFAILCENYRMRGEFETILPQRGLPQDLSPQLAQECEQWKDESWAHQWYLLSEILAFDWDQPVRMKQALAPCEYVPRKRAGQLIETDPAMERLITEVGEEAAARFLWGQECPIATVSYFSTYREEGSNLITFDVPHLLKLGEPDKVRVIVWVTC